VVKISPALLVKNNPALTYLGKKISAELSYGEILKSGVRSDLILHPTMELSFEKTTDIEFVYGLYMVVLQFLQFSLHKQGYNMHFIDLCGVIDGRESNLGCLYNHLHIATHYRDIFETNYLFFDSYVENLLALFASDSKISINHFPSNGDSYHYDSIRFASVFSAFEYECKAAPSLYSNASDQEVANMKRHLVDELNDIDVSDKTDAEKMFLSQAKNRIEQLWTEYGQVKKIENAFNVLQGALTGSLNQIFRNMEIESSINKNIKKVAKDLSALRGKIIHGEMSYTFTDEEQRSIRFLDILSYSQTLKRANIPDEAIELIIGCVFYCNFKFNDYYFSIFEKNSQKPNK